MLSMIYSRAFRLRMLFGGLFLLIGTLFLMQTTANNGFDIWSVHNLTLALLRTSRHQSDNISKATTLHNSSKKSLDIVDRLKSATNVLIDATPTNNNLHRQRVNESRLIVDWTTFFGKKLSILANDTMSLCPVQCIYSNDRTLVDRADAVLFHIRDTHPEKLPPVRHSFQRYIFFLMESPPHSGSAVSGLSTHFFNWTMTYRFDSDIHLVSERLLPKNFTGDYPYTKSEYSWDYVLKVAMGKKKMIAQFVSNCHTPSKRENYTEELAKSISVDVYGSCSRKNCSRDKEECNKMLTNDYLFYLAFENSVCLDYVTEKFWRMKMLIVPIVLRASEYARIAPNGSYIAADQFASPKHLAEYLNRLANNRTEYLTYFEWTKHFWYSSASQKSYCDLCIRLHDDTLPPKSYDNMKEWWTTKGNCQVNFAQKLITSKRS